jgi:DNA-binding CsgD family transcriptional regulator
MTPNVESINREATSYLRSVSGQINSICEPLFKNSPITTCHYSRLFAEGRYLGLSTNSAWGEHIIKYGYQWRTSFFQTELKNLSTSSFRRLLWPASKEDALIQDAAFLKIGSGITFARVKDDYIESYNFAAEINNFSVQLFYINNLSILEDFMVYFQSKISSFLDDIYTYPFAISPTKINFAIYTDSFLQGNLINSPFQKPGLDSCLNSLKILSAQELHCIFYMSQGKTAKEIARLMGLSPRTIEYYLDNIRRKTGCRRKVEIIKFLKL